MERLRLPIEKDDYSLALALGGMKNGFCLSDITGGYACLANGGLYQPCGFATRIKINGNTVYVKPVKKARVFSEDTAYLMSDILRTTAKSGTAKKLRSLPCEIAAKTGTVGTADGNTDAYALSYTPNDVISVWIGNANNAKIETTGGGLPCSILLQVNEYLCTQKNRNGITLPRFTRPNSILEILLDKETYEKRHELILADDNSPQEFTLKELFKTSEIPLSKSSSFSNPTIIPPSLQLKNDGVSILFDHTSPQYYNYKIERKDDIKSVVLYEGSFIKEFFDDTIKMNTRYIYTITPSYNRFVGKQVILPSVTLQPNKTPTQKEEEMLQKDWWKY